MKIYLSADIEGVTGTTHWNETDRKKAEYGVAREQMTAEVAAACRGALTAGAEDILVLDAHDTGMNLIASKLPREVKLGRGWSRHPFCMVDFLDESFDALLLVGYHSRAGSGANPLSHTLTGKPAHIRINDRYASEFLLSAYAASTVGVPVAFVSGDEGLCDEVKEVNPSIGTVDVKRGVGGATVSIHPEVATELIEEGVRKALGRDLGSCVVQLPGRFLTEIRYKRHEWAYSYSFFPGAELVDDHTIRFETDDFFEVLRLLKFVV
jgi:D-amino peptidase